MKIQMSGMMTKTVDWYVHINRGTIDTNRNNGKRDPTYDFAPPISVRKGKSGKSRYGFEVQLPVGSTILYSPVEDLLSCGAKVVIKCHEEPVIFTITGCFLSRVRL